MISEDPQIYGIHPVGDTNVWSNFMAIYPAVVELFYIKQCVRSDILWDQWFVQHNFFLLWHLLRHFTKNKKCQPTHHTRVHPLGTMNACVFCWGISLKTINLIRLTVLEQKSEDHQNHKGESSGEHEWHPSNSWDVSWQKGWTECLTDIASHRSMAQTCLNKLEGIWEEWISASTSTVALT